jgi:hypothetical protein
LKTPPLRPTSSPITTTAESRRISSWMASWTASIIVTPCAAAADGAAAPSLLVARAAGVAGKAEIRSVTEDAS